MKEIKCYRIRQGSGWAYRLETDERLSGEKIVLSCRDEVRVGRSGVGSLLLYGDGPYGVHPEQAIRLGWCHLCEEEDGDEPPGDEVPGAV